ncbi:LptA/OstA family protein [Brevirhabdus sp.]|uniref:LptA/OstA family protein n=1 Tax=Brevirhabdus sp. TaxID=2004514 RepID=UPI00405A1AFF
MNSIRMISLSAALLAAAPAMVSAQGAQVAFGGLKHDSTLPVEVTSDQLAVDQTDGSAVFTGNVVVGQGAMRLTAGKMRVEYAKGQGTQIDRIVASGGITFVNGNEAIEGQEAVYSLSSSQIVVTGDVLLTQARSAISGSKLVVNLNDGTGTMQGRVKTILQTGK